MPPRSTPPQRNERAFAEGSACGQSPGWRRAVAAHWSKGGGDCARLKQGFHRSVAHLCGLLGWVMAQSALGACPAGAPSLQALGPDLWWIPGAAGDSTPANRGRTDNLLVLRRDGRVWLLGSGASPAAGHALACVLRERLGWRVTDVVNPWARPEVVLGNSAFAHASTPARLWAHDEVAQAMQRQCPRCVERLHQRLGAAAVDLGPQPIVIPPLRLQGSQGTLGPWQWWRLERAPGSVVTVWHVRGSAWWWAPGLLWSDGPPDLRDAHTATLASSLAHLDELTQDAPEPPRWLPTQGEPLPPDAPRTQHFYVRRLPWLAQQRQDSGTLETDPPPVPDGPAYLSQGERASLNWQRVWRQVESATAPR